MFEIKYGVVEETYRMDNDARNSYGIAAYDAEDGTVTVLASVHDIFNNEQKAYELAEKCNESGLSLEHFNDAVNDFINA